MRLTGRVEKLEQDQQRRTEHMGGGVIMVDMTPDDIRAGKSLFEVARERGQIGEALFAALQRGERMVVLLPTKCQAMDLWLAAGKAREDYFATHSGQEWATQRAKALGLEIILTEEGDDEHE